MCYEVLAREENRCYKNNEFENVWFNCLQSIWEKRNNFDVSQGMRCIKRALPNFNRNNNYDPSHTRTLTVFIKTHWFEYAPSKRCVFVSKRSAFLAKNASFLKSSRNWIQMETHKYRFCVDNHENASKWKRLRHAHFSCAYRLNCVKPWHSAFSVVSVWTVENAANTMAWTPTDQWHRKRILLKRISVDGA